MDKNTLLYRRSEFDAVRNDADTNYMPSIVIRSDSGQTKHLAISWDEFERIADVLAPGSALPTHYQHLDAGHNTNGNPRRVFVLYDAQGDIVRAIDEGYGGTPAEVRDLVQLPSYSVSATTRRELLRDHQ